MKEELNLNTCQVLFVYELRNYQNSKITIGNQKKIHSFVIE